MKKKLKEETVGEQLDRIKQELGERMYKEYILRFGRVKSPKTP